MSKKYNYLYKIKIGEMRNSLFSKNQKMILSDSDVNKYSKVCEKFKIDGDLNSFPEFPDESSSRNTNENQKKNELNIFFNRKSINFEKKIN